MTVLQLGCFRLIDPHIQDFIDSNYKVYLVDANPQAIEEIQKQINTDNVYTFSIAIEEFTGETILYKTGILNEDYIASVSKETFHKHRGQSVQQKVDCITFTDLLETLNLSKIEYLYIDIEGKDNLVLKEIIDNNLDVDNIVYETPHIDNSIKAKFIDRGYKIRELDAYNTAIYKQIVPPFNPL